MQYTTEQYFHFLTFIGRCDVNVYEDGSVGFIPLHAEYPTFGGKTWQSAVDNGIRRFAKKKLYEIESVVV
jgi:hypothetical protein